MQQTSRPDRLFTGQCPSGQSRCRTGNVRRVNRHEHRSRGWTARIGIASSYRLPPHPMVSARILLALGNVGCSQRVAHGSVASRHHGAPRPLRGGQLLGDCRRSRSWPSYSSLVAAMVFLGRGAAGARLCDLESRLARSRIRGPARRAGMSVGNCLHECRGPSLPFVCGGPSGENGELSNASDSR